MSYVVTMCFILMDLITGLVGAFKNKDFKSCIMREGLYHKAGSVLIIVFFTLIDYSQRFVDLGFSVPIAGIGCAYICLMEVGSIIENISKINPELTPEFIQKIFNSKK